MSQPDLREWTPRQPLSFEPMEGELVRIVELDADAHWRDLWVAFGGGQGADVWHYMPIGPFSDEASFADGMAALQARRPDWLPFAILDKATGKAMGTASYMRIDAASGSAEVGAIAFGEGLKRRAAGTETMLLMARRVFDELGYRRYEWKCDANNTPSVQAAKRLGFTYEGTFRQHMVVKGRNRDTAWFSITDKEWPRISVGMARWLAPENFDAAGRQRQSLRDVIAAQP